MALDYKKAGVNVEAGYEAVRLMKKSVESTFSSNVLGGIGGFGGLYRFGESDGPDTPVLVSGTDGVGTKLKVAFLMDRHNTIGIDAVAMCVNDIICSGARPMFFLDYIACEHNDPQQIASIVEGVAAGCRESFCSLIGGETAEHPGMMPKGEYDIAGFAVGSVLKKHILDGSRVQEGDVLIGLASSGPHSNGFSLIRQIFSLHDEAAKETLQKTFDVLESPLGEVLLAPTRLYVKAWDALYQDDLRRGDQDQWYLKAMSHITGGGFYENIPRMLPPFTKAVIEKGSWEIPPIFSLMQKLGDVSEKDMYNTFNMGLGMILAVAKEGAQQVLQTLQEAGEKAWIVGRVEKSDEEKAGIVL